jgi:uncharacterized radical SAM superfamily Fe-S cluster-containing enzyme
MPHSTVSSTTQARPAVAPEQIGAACTYSGTPLEPVPRGLPKAVRSLCPQCRKCIDATLFEADGKVWMTKTCPEHGAFRDLYYSDVELFHKCERFYYGDEAGLANPTTRRTAECPYSCGLCDGHVSHTGLGNIDLTNRCNLKCPVCFANSDATGYVFELTWEQIVRSLQAFRDMRPVAGRAIQFSGGEPTLHPKLPEAIREAKRMGFSHIQIATNALRVGQEPDYVRRLEDAGLDDLYFQFDGVTDDVYEYTRGRAGLWEIKQQAVENVRGTRMKVCLVPTILRGVNDQQVGDIVKFALANVDVIAGISFQPVAFCGRIDETKRIAQRYTLADLAHGVSEQTGITRVPDDWFPLSCVQPFSRMVSAIRGEQTMTMSCHPHCSLGTYLFVGTDGVAVPFSRFFDIEPMLSTFNRISSRYGKARFKLFQKIKALGELKGLFNADAAPTGMTFKKFLHTLNGMIDKEVGRGESGERTFRTLMVAGMHFMDAYNYDTARAQRCVVHFCDPEGRMYPFCTYNAGPVYRSRVEPKFALTPEQFRQRTAKTAK